MGEQPLFMCKAHVFQLEPELKKSWIALSTVAVNVQIFHDPIKNIYRIVSVEGTKALINSIVTPRMTFTKTSQKFGQWIDFKLNLVYGLGFANDVELNKFVDKFKEIKEMTRSTTTMLRPHERSNSCEITSLNRHTLNDSNDSNDLQLKYENEKLRLALAQTSQNNRKIEDEMHILKTNNMRLTAALQETQSNMEAWKKELQFYRDECNRLKNLNSSNSSKNDSDQVTSSTNFITSTNQVVNGSNNAKLKQDLLQLTDTFDRKFNELLDIREQLRNLINEINGNGFEDVKKAGICLKKIPGSYKIFDLTHSESNPSKNDNAKIDIYPIFDKANFTMDECLLDCCKNTNDCDFIVYDLNQTECIKFDCKNNCKRLFSSDSIFNQNLDRYFNLLNEKNSTYISSTFSNKIPNFTNDSFSNSNAYKNETGNSSSDTNYMTLEEPVLNSSSTKLFSTSSNTLSSVEVTTIYKSTREPSSISTQKVSSTLVNFESTASESTTNIPDSHKSITSVTFQAKIFTFSTSEFVQFEFGKDLSLISAIFLILGLIIGFFIIIFVGIITILLCLSKINRRSYDQIELLNMKPYHD
ncbi:unnamed protein product [Brachionus calyciflorus]|uniref:WH1 domain-containing protein n=1 Tax=Brachionus calyciflorus TaxID=104777 RepID=A0A813WD72_9BILA|nr:unnamed protein product [Brachionus calyciflorus]